MSRGDVANEWRRCELAVRARSFSRCRERSPAVAPRRRPTFIVAEASAVVCDLLEEFAAGGHLIPFPDDIAGLCPLRAGRALGTKAKPAPGSHRMAPFPTLTDQERRL